MAASYTVVSQRRTVQVLSQTQVADVEEVGFITHPTGIYSQREVPIQAWQTDGAGPWIGTLADAIEGLISGGLATGAVFVQDVDASGLIADFMDFTVSYTPPGGIGLPMTSIVRVPINALTLDTSFGSFTGTSPADMLSAAHDALVYTAGL
jgi:hypothetical protein